MVFGGEPGATPASSSASRVTSLEASRRVVELMSRLRASLDAHHADWAVGDLSLAGAGLESAVFRAETRELGAIAVRVPWQRWISNDNDPALDARALLEKEALLARHMAGNGVPAPRVIAIHQGDDDFDYLVSELIDNDRSPPSSRAFGGLMRQIHETPIITEPFVRQPAIPLGEVIADRLVQRAAVVERLAAVRLPLPSHRELRERLSQHPRPSAILHMDARHDNLLTSLGEIRAIIDWSNALIGDPALELARIAEYGNIDAAFSEGYAERRPYAAPPPELDRLYRLDTAVMLAVVFLSEAPDPRRAPQQVGRVQELLATSARKNRH
jgi:aminoglycoside phosphotransferase (APT) family kinase protein